MPAFSIHDELQQWGPEAHGKPLSLPAARDYCRRLARSHYENFVVASCLLPPDLRAHFHAVYAYCRWADDLADEIGDPRESLELLAWWERELENCYRGRARHPVFTALAETIEWFQIPEDPFRDLLSAFRQDQRQNRYATRAELLEYCRRSANPVGRLVLYLGGCHNPANTPAADALCTGLQLINFWQDIARDRDRGRIYVPQESWVRHGVSEADFHAPRASESFRLMLTEEVAWAARLLEVGRPLAAAVPASLAADVELFIEGGLAVAAAIRRRDYDVLARRVRVSKWRQFQLLARAWWRTRRAIFAPRRRTAVK